VFSAAFLFVHTNLAFTKVHLQMNHTHQPPNSCQLLFTRSNSTTSHFLSRQSARLKAVRFWTFVSNKFHSLEICINLHHSSKSKEGHVLYQQFQKRSPSIPSHAAAAAAAVFKHPASNLVIENFPWHSFLLLQTCASMELGKSQSVAIYQMVVSKA
jgi:hypothetical protein